MPDQWMPGAVQRPIPYRAEAGTFAAEPLGWVLHVTVSNGSPFVTFRDAKSPNRRFSTMWVSKAGVIEQYAERSCKPWAQANGNGTYWAVETEGFPNEALTPQQVTALARIHAWFGTPNQLAEKPGDRGIGTHYMGGQAWGGHTCPDPSPGAGPRSKQRTNIITAATTGGFLMALTDAQQAEMYTKLCGTDAKSVATRGDANTVRNDIATVHQTVIDSTDPAKIAAAIPPEIAQQVIDALAAKLAAPAS